MRQSFAFLPPLRRGTRAILSPLIAAVALTTALGACRDATPKTAADSQAAHVREVAAAGGVVDTVHSIEEELRRFRETVPDAPDTLRSASSSIDAVAQRWAAAIAARDTGDLNAMVLDRAEFAWLYYPGSKLSLPPYESPPRLLWGQILASSDEGARAALAAYGGRRLSVVRVRCPEPVEVEGQNRLHSRCLVTLRVDGTLEPERRLFGTIVERDGRFKLLGLANAL